MAKVIIKNRNDGYLKGKKMLKNVNLWRCLGMLVWDYLIIKLANWGM